MLSKKSWSSSGTSFRRLLLCVCTRKCRGKSSNCFQCASFLVFSNDRPSSRYVKMYCRAYLPLSSSKKANNWMIFVLISVRPIQSCPLKDPQIFSNRFQPPGDHHCGPLFTSICRQRFGRWACSHWINWDNWDDDGSNLWKQWEESPVINTAESKNWGKLHGIDMIVPVEEALGNVLF